MAMIGLLTSTIMSAHGLPSGSAGGRGDWIRLEGVTHHNLKNISVAFPLGEITVVTGVSGSGKSSLVFDTLYAAAQRRYVETFSPYARQFLQRMDKPAVAHVSNTPPAIALAQNNAVRSTRSTVGSLTELNDDLRQLFSLGSVLFCPCCQVPVHRQDSRSMTQLILARSVAIDVAPSDWALTFEVSCAGLERETVVDALRAQGYDKFFWVDDQTLAVIQRRWRSRPDDGGSREDRKQQFDTMLAAVEAATARAVSSAVTLWKLSAGWASMDTQQLLAQQALTQQVSDQGMLDKDLFQHVGYFQAGLVCQTCESVFSPVTPAHFSDQSPLGACEACQGFGRVLTIDPERVVPDASKSLRDGAVKPWQTESFSSCQADLLRFAKRRGLSVDLPWTELSQADRDWVWQGDAEFDGNWEGRFFYGIKRFFDWLETRTYKMHVRVLLSKYRRSDVCQVCQGSRLKPQIQAWQLVAPGAEPVRVSFTAMQQWPLSQLQAWFTHWLSHAAEAQKATEVAKTWMMRLGYLIDVGLGYLTLSRLTKTLSGGEVQRIHLTTALGSSLTQTLFVLDEPSVGLHPRDVDRVGQAIQRLCARGNTVVMVEHDPQLMRYASHWIDMGPGAGEQGGDVVVAGPLAKLREVAAEGRSVTARYLSAMTRIVRAQVNRKTGNAKLVISNIHAHHCQNVRLDIPLNNWVVMTGVSGSGKSTLIQDVLVPALKRHYGEESEPPLGEPMLEGCAHLAGVAFIDQSLPQKSARSMPITWLGGYDRIRQLFAATPDAQEQGCTAGFFSVNSGEGRCAQCGGTGSEYVDMQFLSDVYLTCSACQGLRFSDQALSVRWTSVNGQHYSIADVLALTVDEASRVFEGDAALMPVFEALRQVGLAYLPLGQPLPACSGGEVQRLRLAAFLLPSLQANVKRSRGKAAGSVLSTTEQARLGKGMLFVLDEPTTGLHQQDVQCLVDALQALLAVGHSVLMIEHHLDMIRLADWVIDVGPEAGDQGGKVVFCGTPTALQEAAFSHTGEALKQYSMVEQGVLGEALMAPPLTAPPLTAPPLTAPPFAVPPYAAHEQSAAIQLRGAREHNLKNIDVAFPHHRLTVLTGPSGSGKSTLAFDIVFAEGQRRYLDSLSPYARQFLSPLAKPAVDAIEGIPPAVAVAQRESRGGWKSTVATATEIYNLLRVLMVKAGQAFCPSCDCEVASQSVAQIVDRVRLLMGQGGAKQPVALWVPLVSGRKGHFRELGQWLQGQGYEQVRIDDALYPVQDWPALDRHREHRIELAFARGKAADDVERFAALVPDALALSQRVQRVVQLKGDGEAGGRLRLSMGDQSWFFSTSMNCPQCAQAFPPLDPRLFAYTSRHGWCLTCLGTGCEPDRDSSKHASRKQEQEAVGAELSEILDALREEGVSSQVCVDCRGQRLNPFARHVRLKQKSIAELCAQPAEPLRQWLQGQSWSARELQLFDDAFAELQQRLRFLHEVGLDYLHLDRAVPTLSGGEAQRVRLAAHLGSALRGACYVLDEPTIGLHAQDTAALIEVIRRIQTRGNTVLVVEHDTAMMRAADHLIDMGPGAGREGGRIVAQGSIKDLLACEESPTAPFLQDRSLKLAGYRMEERTGSSGSDVLRGPQPAGQSSAVITIRDLTVHNLQRVSVDIPLHAMVVVAGVSGAGKSTLVNHGVTVDSTVLQRDASAMVSKLDASHRLIRIDQSPIGRSSRSTVATYLGLWDEIRRLFAGTELAKTLGYGIQRFSFNSGTGRCAHCEGQGVQVHSMRWLPDVSTVCEVCHGQRFNQASLAVQWRGFSIADVMNMSVAEALQVFEHHRSIANTLRWLDALGLGYITLGQPSNTLSGGEAQRIKLAESLQTTTWVADGMVSAVMSPSAVVAETSGKKRKSSVVMKQSAVMMVLDEPTVGLHPRDIQRLIQVLRLSVRLGHSVLVIEHELPLIAAADWVIELGPGAGSRGGQIVAACTPAELASMDTATGRALGGACQHWPCADDPSLRDG